MKYRIALVITSVLLLSACSGGPSSSDAKDAVLRRIGGECSRLSIENFEKVNGVAQGDNLYQVSVKYDIQISPPSNGETPEQWSAQYEDISNKADQASKDADADYNEKSAYEHDHNGQANPQLDQKTHDQYALRDKLMAQRDALGNEPVSSFLKECPKLTRTAFADLNESISGNHKAFLAGFTVHQSGTLNMIKTDNGWMEGNE